METPSPASLALPLSLRFKGRGPEAALARRWNSHDAETGKSRGEGRRLRTFLVRRRIPRPARSPVPGGRAGGAGVPLGRRTVPPGGSAEGGTSRRGFLPPQQELWRHVTGFPPSRGRQGGRDGVLAGLGYRRDGEITCVPPDCAWVPASAGTTRTPCFRRPAGLRYRRDGEITCVPPDCAWVHGSAARRHCEQSAPWRRERAAQLGVP